MCVSSNLGGTLRTEGAKDLLWSTRHDRTLIVTSSTNDVIWRTDRCWQVSSKDVHVVAKDIVTSVFGSALKWEVSSRCGGKAPVGFRVSGTTQVMQA